MTFLNSESASCVTVEETARLLNTELNYGLSNEDVTQRRKLYAYNEFEIKHTEPLWKKYLEKACAYNMLLTQLESS